VTGLVLFVVACGTVLCRLLVYAISPFFGDDLFADTMLDLIFSGILQLGFLLAAPMLLYKFLLKNSWRDNFRFQNYRKTDWKILLLCVPLGIAGMFVTVGISLFWQVLMYMLFGYAAATPTVAMPAAFPVGYFLLAVFLTGVLPGVCEENANRGGLITTLRGSFSEGKTILLGGLIFGLFHQYVSQSFYTFMFGLAFTFLVLKTKSVFPGMIMHFVNNALSVYLDYAETYGLFGGKIFPWMQEMLSGLAENPANLPTLAGLYLGACALFAGILFLIVWLCKRNRKKAIDRTVRYIEGNAVVEVNRDKGIIGEPLSDTIRYKPTLRDNAFFLAALALTVLTTVFSLVWGYF
jgi:membrane protease YdiL (CAAX protease family)